MREQLNDDDVIKTRFGTSKVNDFFASGMVNHNLLHEIECEVLTTSGKYKGEWRKGFMKISMVFDPEIQILPEPASIEVKVTECTDADL